MRFEMIDEGETCVLKEKTCSSSAFLRVDAPKADVVALINALLMDPDAREKANGKLRIDRMRDGPRLTYGAGSFTLPYTHVFALVS